MGKLINTWMKQGKMGLRNTVNEIRYGSWKQQQITFLLMEDNISEKSAKWQYWDM